MSKKWMSRALALMLTLAMLLTGVVFAEDPATEASHEKVETTEPAQQEAPKTEAPADETPANEGSEGEAPGNEGSKEGTPAEEETPVEEETTEERIEESDNACAEETTEECIEEPTEAPVEESTDESVDASIEETMDAFADEPVDVLTDESVNEIAAEAAGDSQWFLFSLRSAAAECAHENWERCVCADCGETVHMGLNNDFHMANAEYEYIDEDYHYATGDYVNVYSCWECHTEEISSEVIEQRKMKEDHDADPGEDCACGYTMPEEESEETGHEHELNGCWCETCGKDFHELDGCWCFNCGKSFHTYEDCVCITCGETNHEVPEGACVCSSCGATQHSYDEWGTCICNVCGKEEHTVSTTWTDYGYTDATYTYLDMYYHIVKGTAVYAYCCGNCGKTVQTVKEIGATEAKEEHHDSDICPCGYNNSGEGDADCAHEKTVVEYTESYGTFSKPNAAGHTRTYDVWAHTVCADCHAELKNEKSQTGATEVLPHFNQTNEGGYWTFCFDCGYKPNCEHGNAVDEIFEIKVSVYVSVDEENHTHKGYMTIAPHCPDCNLWVVEDSAEWVSNNQLLYKEITEAHDMKDGVCELCGYAAKEGQPEPTTAPSAGPTMPTSTPAPTAVPTPAPTQPADDGDEELPPPVDTPACTHENMDHCKCIDCGETVHQGEVSCMNYDMINVTNCRPLDANYHQADGDYVMYTKYCDTCGEYTAYTVLDQRTGKWMHSFEEGVCPDCGAEEPEEHVHVREDGDCYCWMCDEYVHDWDGCECTNCGVIAHTYDGEDCVCEVCGEEAHNDEDEDCECDVCAAEMHFIEEGMIYDSATTVPSDYKYCKTTMVGKLVEHCWQCDTVFGVIEENYTAEEYWMHDFEDPETGEEGDTCINCGYTTPEDCECTGDTEFVTREANRVFTKVDASGHTYTYDLVKDEICLACGKVVATETKEDQTKTSKHVYSIYDVEFEDDILADSSSRCMICMYAPNCACTTTTERVVYIDPTAAYTKENGSTHKVSGHMEILNVCTSCGREKGESIWGENTRTLPHNMVNGKCSDCGYTKPAATATPTATATATPTPAPTATPAPEPTAAPGFTEVEETVAVNGVKVEDKTEMVDTLVTVAETLEAEGETTTIEIVNIEKVITAEEKAILDTLTIKEQMLTFLSVIGFEEQVNQSLAGNQETLSAEADALKTQIMSRINAMDETARAEFETALLESFPSQQVLIDGVEYTFFVLEIEVRRGDETRIERYGFRREGEEWIFTKLFIED